MPIKAEEGKWIIVAAINHTELNHNKFIVPEPGWSRVTRAGWDTELGTWQHTGSNPGLRQTDPHLKGCFNIGASLIRNISDSQNMMQIVFIKDIIRIVIA